MSKQDKKIVNAQSKMDKELTWDEAVDSVITTPQSQWSPYQIAVANLNPDLKSRNKRYQSALNSRNVLENEKVNLWQAWELMMNAYRDAIQHTEDAANQMIAANSAQAAIQAWWAISGSAGLSTNPAAAAATRIAAQNNATAQNMQIRSNADQNIANLYGNVAQVPSTLANISANNAQMEANAQQAIANANLANAQAAYYSRQSSWWSWWSYSRWWWSSSWWWSNSWWWQWDNWWLQTVINWIDITKLETVDDWDYKVFRNPETDEIIQPTNELVEAYNQYHAKLKAEWLE